MDIVETIDDKYNSFKEYIKNKNYNQEEILNALNLFIKQSCTIKKQLRNTLTIPSKNNIKNNQETFFLTFLNDILKNCNKNPIDKIEDFKYIAKDELETKENNDVIEKYKQHITDLFGKNISHKLIFLHKKILLKLLRVFCQNLGYKFTSKKTTRSRKNQLTGDHSVKGIIVYFISK